MHRLLVTASAVALCVACGPTAATTASTSAPSAGGAAAAAPTPRPARADVAALALADTVVTVHTLEDAVALSAGEKDILLVFAGSDWCSPCKVFKRSVLSEAAFLSGGKDDYVVVYLDFPSKKRNQLPPEQKAYNEAKAEVFNPQGVFPRIILLDPAGEVVSEVKFAGQTAEVFLGELAAARG